MGWPGGLIDALDRRGATGVDAWREGRRTFVRVATPGGPFFARWSSDPGDVARYEHEARARAVVRRAGSADLTAPAVVDAGPGWMVEEHVDAEAASGAEVMGAVARAAFVLPTLALPHMAGARRGGRLATAAFRVRVLRSPLPTADVVRARAIVDDPALPIVGSHGDFHPGNALWSDGRVWLVDYELAGDRPLAYDALEYWCSVPDETDAAALFDAVVVAAGSSHEAALRRLRYAVAVRIAASLLASDNLDSRDPDRARRLLSLLPELRAEAAVASAKLGR